MHIVYIYIYIVIPFNLCSIMRSLDATWSGRWHDLLGHANHGFSWGGWERTTWATGQKGLQRLWDRVSPFWVGYIHKVSQYIYAHYIYICDVIDRTLVAGIMIRFTTVKDRNCRGRLYWTVFTIAVSSQEITRWTVGFLGQQWTPPFNGPTSMPVSTSQIVFFGLFRNSVVAATVV
jgi:hypothetical protein